MIERARYGMNGCTMAVQLRPRTFVREQGSKWVTYVEIRN